MNITERFTHQHHEILALCTRLQECCIEKHIRHDASFVYKLQKELEEVLSLHARLENTALFPMLSEHADPGIRKTVVKLQDEFIPYSHKYRTYQEKYSLPSDIESTPRSYVEDTQSIINLLKKRIRQEEQELYRHLR